MNPNLINNFLNQHFPNIEGVLLFGSYITNPEKANDVDLILVSDNKELCLVKLEKSLSPKLNKNNLEREIINITDSINCLNWDSLLIESGYATNESILKYYGLTIPYDFNNSNLDSEALIFFIKNNKIINHVKFNTTCRKFEKCKTYDFKTLIKYNKEAIISKKDAVFEVFTKKTTNNRGEKWIQKNAIRLKKS